MHPEKAQKGGEFGGAVDDVDSHQERAPRKDRRPFQRRARQMKNPMRSKKRVRMTCLFALLVALCMGGIWCSHMSSQDPNIDLTSGVHFAVYEAGKVVHSGERSANSTFVQELARLLRSRSGKWERSRVTYAPGIVLRGRTFSITIQQKRVIVNYSDENDIWHQVVSAMSTTAFDELKEELLNPSER